MRNCRGGVHSTYDALHYVEFAIHLQPEHEVDFNGMESEKQKVCVSLFRDGI